MSRISELSSDPRNIINFIDILSLFCPDGKTKYVETLLRIIKKTNNLGSFAEESKNNICQKYNIDKTKLEKYDDLQTVFLRKFLESVFNEEDLKLYSKFCILNENNQITDNDLSLYSNFTEIENSVKFAELKLEMKKMEHEVIKLHEDNEWVLVKPLTYEASKKYGAGTKWCTSSEEYPHHFDTYAKGILIYVINKRTNLKIAVNKVEGVTKFWKSIDKNIESMDSGLPIEILMIIKKDLDTEKKGNLSLKK